MAVDLNKVNILTSAYQSSDAGDTSNTRAATSPWVCGPAPGAPSSNVPAVLFERMTA